MSSHETITAPPSDCKAPATTWLPEISPHSRAQFEYHLLTGQPAPHDRDSFNYTVYPPQRANKRTTSEPHEHWFAKDRSYMHVSPSNKSFRGRAHCDAVGNITLLGNDAAAPLIDTAGVVTRPALRNKKA